MYIELFSIWIYLTLYFIKTQIDELLQNRCILTFGRAHFRKEPFLKIVNLISKKAVCMLCNDDI